MTNFFQTIFSVKNYKNYKTITILGFRIKIKLHRGV